MSAASYLRHGWSTLISEDFAAWLATRVLIYAGAGIAAGTIFVVGTFLYSAAVPLTEPTRPPAIDVPAAKPLPMPLPPQEVEKAVPPVFEDLLVQGAPKTGAAVFASKDMWGPMPASSGISLSKLIGVNAYDEEGVVGSIEDVLVDTNGVYLAVSASTGPYVVEFWPPEAGWDAVPADLRVIIVHPEPAPGISGAQQTPFAQVLSTKEVVARYPAFYHVFPAGEHADGPSGGDAGP